MQFDKLKEKIDAIIENGDGFKYTYYKLKDRQYLMVEQFSGCVIEEYLMINETDGRVSGCSYNKRDLSELEILETIEEMKNEIQKSTLQPS